jgi:hypothetical protein
MPLGGSVSVEHNRGLEFLGSFLEVKKEVPAEHLISGGRDFHDSTMKGTASQSVLDNWTESPSPKRQRAVHYNPMRLCATGSDHIYAENSRAGSTGLSGYLSGSEQPSKTTSYRRFSCRVLQHKFRCGQGILWWIAGIVG